MVDISGIGSDLSDRNEEDRIQALEQRLAAMETVSEGKLKLNDFLSIWILM